MSRSLDSHAAPARAEPLLAPGNPLRARGLVVLIAGALVGVAVMASTAGARIGVPLAGAASLVVIFGLLDLMGSFDDPDARLALRVRGAELKPGLALALGGAIGGFVLLSLAVAGVLPALGSALGLPVACLAFVAGLFRLGEALGPWRGDRGLMRRHGFWLVALATVLYLPMLGNKSLIDPWETHYGEVSREILVRGDWISLWWAQDGWFWSKPVLTFWLQAIAMAVLGVRYQPGQMLSAVEQGFEPQPEWALRMPVFVLVVLGVYFLYKGVAASHGRRAGFLGGVVLLTMPQFFFVAQQTMTDMPFVAPMAASVGLVLLGMRTDPNDEVRVYELAVGRLRLRLSLFHLVMGAIFAVTVPQILYLFAGNLTIGGSVGFDLHRDVFAAGSPGNCGLPGNAACKPGLAPAHGAIEPVVQALMWTQALALLGWLSWGERRRQRLIFLAAWLFAALATMAKGPAGIGLPVLATLGYIVATGRYRALTQLEIFAGSLVLSAVVLPWGVAMYVRHGQPFVDRLLFHDMFKRAFQHVHDTNRGDDTSFRYYVWQLGYATFPWTGLVPWGLVRGLRGRASSGERGTEVALAAWALLGFALFSVMGTKYHHYCLPVVPPLAMLTGILLDGMWRRASGWRDDDGVLAGAVAMGAALLTLLVGRDLAWQPDGRLGSIRLLHLFTYNYGRPWPAGLDFGAALWIATAAATVCTALLAWPRARRMAAALLAVCATAFAAWSIDVYLVRTSPHWGQRELFVAYERERLEEPGPLIAYQMNWKGENFYRGNRMPAFVSSGARFQQWIDEQKKKGTKVFYFVTEHSRMRTLAAELGSVPLESITDEVLNNKFGLVRVRFP